MATREDDENALEDIVDRRSLTTTLMMLSDIASEKAQHIRENWQDAALARQWDNEASKLETAATKVKV